VFKTTLLIFPLWVWHVSSPLCNSKGLWENGNLVAPTRITLEPREKHVQKHATDENSVAVQLFHW